jgi:prefoldin subunit 5
MMKTAKKLIHESVKMLDADAAEITSLKAEVERLRAALKEIASIGPASDAFANLELTREIARAALKEPRT